MDACSKCGGTDLLVRHVANRQLIDHSSMRKVETEFITSDEYDFFYKLTAAKEHLLKHCRQCQYAWRENLVSVQ